MGAHALQEQTTNKLYVRTGMGVLGPYDSDSLRAMVKNGVLPNDGAVSSDGITWRRADQVKGLFSKRIEPANKKENYHNIRKNISASTEMKRLLNHICDNMAYKYFQPRNIYVATGVIAVISGIIAFFISGMNYGLTMKNAFLFLGITPPIFLLIFCFLASLVNKLIGKTLDISEQEKEFLALHLPRHVFDKLGWGIFMNNWFYGSNWLIGSCDESPNCYIHLFKTGEPLLTIDEDVDLWQRLASSLPYSLRNLCIAGEGIRQIQITDSLPKWSKTLSEVTDGYVLGGILDENYTEWAKNFIVKAKKRLSLSVDNDVDFFLTYFDITEQDSVLAVCVFPREEEDNAKKLSRNADQEVIAA